VLRAVLGAPAARDLVVVDTTDPERVGAVLDGLEPGDAAVLAVSKSGTTAETSALLDIFWHQMRAALGDAASRRFVVVTEPGTKMARLAEERSALAVLPHPVDVGGRYSALSDVGILPALWLGHDAERLLAGGAAGLADLHAGHPGVHLAATLAAVAEDGWARLALCPSPRLSPLAGWIEQLVAESTGKEGRGVLPIPLPEPPSPDQALPLTVFYSPRFTGESTGALDAALDRLAAAGHPVLRCELPNGDLGHAFTVLELATALLGFLLGVNPFDEPNVARAKQRANEALSAGAPAMPAAVADPARPLIDLLETVRPEDVVVLLAYLPENDRVARLLDELALAVGRRSHAPVTTAFGPRYLHSTGQLHKGGPDRVVPVLLTAEPARDVPVPGRELTLGRLRAAQALGDLAALREAGRRVLHLHLGARPAPTLQAMLAGLAAPTP
jgi:hypothetical protein